MKKMSLWKKYFTLYAVCLLCAVVMIILMFFVKMYIENKDMITSNVQNVIYFSDLNLSEKIKSIEDDFAGMGLAERFKNASEAAAKRSELQKLVENICGENNEVLSIFYRDTENNCYSAGEPMGDLEKRLDKIEQAQKSEEFENKGRRWFFSKTENKYNACVLYRKIVFLESSYQREEFGDILIYVDIDRINDKYFGNIEKNTGIIFTDSDNIITVASDDSLVGEKLSKCFEIGKNKIYDNDGNSFYYYRKDSKINGWHNICYYKTGSTFPKLWKAMCMVLPAALLILFAMIYVSYYFTRRLSKPLEELVEYVGISDEGTVILEKVSDKKAERDEIMKIKSIFDNMSYKLKHQIEANYQNEICIKNALIKAYESQMNPHFLYNTLQIIQMMSVVGRCDDIKEITTCMGKLLRFNLSEDSETTLGAEIENINNYFKILKYRFGEGFSYRIMVSDELMKCSVIKFMLQPFVENSMNHGFEKQDGQFEIAIVVVRINDELAIVIRDNGCGINNERLSEIKDILNGGEARGGIGIGISNVNKRIKLIYGENFGVDVFSKPGNTQVIIHIPYKE